MTIANCTPENSPESSASPGGVHGDESAAVSPDRIATSNCENSHSESAQRPSGVVVSAETETACGSSAIAGSELLQDLLPTTGETGDSTTPTPSPAKPSGRKASGKGGVVGKARDRVAERARRIENCGLTIGRCGKIAESARRNVGVFREVLRQSVLQARGIVAIPDVLSINAAARWELHAQMTAAFLRRDEEKMSAAERLAHSKAIADASTQRDKCVERLRLNGSTAEATGDTLQDVYAELERERALTVTEQPAPVVQSMAEHHEEATTAAAPFEQLDGPAAPAPPLAAVQSIAVTIADLVHMEDL